MTDHRTKLQELLRELFQLDLADLDYGIYRIMSLRRAEVEACIEKGLLDAVAEEFTVLEKDALAEKDIAAAVKLWQKVFGKEYFPSSVELELAERKRLASFHGTISISSAGAVMTDNAPVRSVQLPPTRFYGKDE